MKNEKFKQAAGYFTYTMLDTKIFRNIKWLIEFWHVIWIFDSIFDFISDYFLVSQFFSFLMGVFYTLLLLNSIFQSQLKHCFSFSPALSTLTLHLCFIILLGYLKFGENYDRGFWNTFVPSILCFIACSDGQKSNQSGFRTLHYEMFLKLPPTIPTTFNIALP